MVGDRRSTIIVIEDVDIVIHPRREGREEIGLDKKDLLISRQRRRMMMEEEHNNIIGDCGVMI